MFQFENKFLHVEFAPESGGFPSRIAVKAPDGEIFLVPGGKESTFAIRLGNGKTLHPVLPEGYEPDRYALEECRRVQFDRIPFTDQYGAKSPDFFLTVRYEFWDDGTVFATSYFVCEKYMTDFSITSCRFQFDLDFSTFQRIGTPFGTQADMASSGNGTVLSDWKK
ncbi:MAG: hypothetical protein J6331_08275, partial [Lentisphaeria bacterium]|nr:hypothetical protein [Lentisphaeria bacterium]